MDLDMGWDLGICTSSLVADWDYFVISVHVYLTGRCTARTSSFVPCLQFRGHNAGVRICRFAIMIIIMTVFPLR